MKKLEQCHRSSFFLAISERSNFVLIVYFEQANFYLIYSEKTNSFEEKIMYTMRYVVVL